MAIPQLISHFTNLIGIDANYSENTAKFIEREYGKKRNSISHGNPQYLTNLSSSNNENKNNLYQLHEITRYAINEFLNLNDENLVKYEDQKLKTKKNDITPFKQFMDKAFSKGDS